MCTHGMKDVSPSSPRVHMQTPASIICDTLYATLVTPAVCPRKLHHPMIHAHSGTFSSGTTCALTKYIPPAVGYAETSSATDDAMNSAITLPMSHAITAVAGPPDASGALNVAGTDPKTPRIEIAYEIVENAVNSRRSSYRAPVGQHDEKCRRPTHLFITYPSEQPCILICRHGRERDGKRSINSEILLFNGRSHAEY